MAKATIEDIPVDSFPEVSELRLKLIEASAEQQTAQAELAHIHRTLDPMPSSSDSSSQPTALEMLRAKQQLPFVEERLLLARAEVLELEPRYEQARMQARQELDAARHEARLPLLKKFSKALTQAAEIGDELRSFDQETVRLGGSDSFHPFAQLLDEPPFRTGEATRVAEFVAELERRS